MPTTSFTIHHYGQLGSTNELARRLAGQGCAHGTVLRADEQTAGRGRYHRTWHSPPGNLMVSVVLRPAVAASRAPELGFVAAVAMAGCVADLLPQGAAVGLKWPNDVQVAGAKVAGLLPEMESTDGAVAWLVLGAGLNLAHAPVDTPYPATSLRAHGAEVSPEQGLQAFLAQLAHWLAMWESDGFPPVRAAWLSRARGLGSEITVQLGDSRIAGTFHDLDNDGALILATAEGTRRITAGEVSFAGS